jgi:hypothetical protein
MRHLSREMTMKVTEIACAVVEERGQLPSVKPKRQHP